MSWDGKSNTNRELDVGRWCYKMDVKSEQRDFYSRSLQLWVISMHF